MLAPCRTRIRRVLLIERRRRPPAPPPVLPTQIVLALTVLTVAVVLFLYFRRNFKPWLTERERLQRRKRNPNYPSPDMQNAVFSGMEDDEPHWQLMPMPVGRMEQWTRVEGGPKADPARPLSCSMETLLRTPGTYTGLRTPGAVDIKMRMAACAVRVCCS